MEEETMKTFFTIVMSLGKTCMVYQCDASHAQEAYRLWIEGLTADEGILSEADIKELKEDKYSMVHVVPMNDVNSVWGSVEVVPSSYMQVWVIPTVKS